MPIKVLNRIQEFFVWVLFCGITFSNATVEISLASIVLLFIIKKIYFRNFKLPNTPINIPLLIFGLLLLFSFTRSSYPDESLRGLIKFLKYSLLYFSVFSFFNEDALRINRFFWVIALVSLFTFLNGIFQDIFGFDILRHHEIARSDYLHRISGSFVHANDFAAFIITLLPLTFIFFSKATMSRNKKILLTVICLLGFYCLLRTSSRSGWIGFLIAVIIYFYFYNKKLSFLIPILVISMIFISPNGFTRVKNLLYIGQDTLWERMQLWKGTWRMVLEHPFLGFGINTFSRNFPDFKPVEYFNLCYTHNSYLQMWSEIGLTGLVSFLLIIFVVLKVSFSQLRKKLTKGFRGKFFLGVLSGYIAFLVQAGLDTNLYSLVLQTLFWVMTALLFCLDKELEGVK
ncbi:MAG TPA: O-antigen ligase family protein [Candidatus Margulisiibacteriota bacterium]|nr:O-antigen ligase family protein [Candidatus Margulisiibacteriota bacterium]